MKVNDLYKLVCKNVKPIVYIAILVFYTIAVYQCGRRCSIRHIDELINTKTTIVTSTDKLPRVIGTKTLYLYRYIYPKKRLFGNSEQPQKENSEELVNVVDNNNKIELDTIKIPISQNVYTGVNYTAYVSGFHQSLDSIEVRERIITNTIVKKRSRWNVGISAGYGINKNGLTPFIGIGVVWNIFR